MGPARQWLVRMAKKMWRWRRNWKRRAIVGLVLVCVTVRSLPYLAPIHSADLAQNQQAIEFIDRNGLPLGTLLTRNQENTAVVPLEKISPHFIDAIIAAEDKRYYQHGALDMQAIARSLLEAIQARQIVSGASTITMQLARMLDPSPRTLPNKTREVWLSWRLVAGMTKDEILAAYINRLPMGGNIYGVEAAARTYFGIPAADLNLAQATILAALPNDPTDLNPNTNWQGLKQRQAYVCDRLVADGYITRERGDRVLAEKISLQPRQLGIIAAPHFLFWVANQLPQQHPSQIRTTLDRSLQQFVETQVQQIVRDLASQNVQNAAALVINNRSGDVLAYVGSPDYFNDGKFGKNDGVQALRQPGSTLKPFLYELALENRIIRPNTVLADIPTHYPIPGAKLYSPIDYSETFHGPVRVRVALANSLNIPAVRVLEKVGVETFLHRLHQLGFVHLTESANHYGLGLALGSGEVSLWELANAYVTLARQGKPTPLLTTVSAQRGCTDGTTRIGNSDARMALHGLGRECTDGTTRIGNSDARMARRGFERGCTDGMGCVDEIKDVAKLIVDMLSDDRARASEFGVDSVLNLPFPAAVKTGTSSNYRDTWTVGFTTDYTVATWVGNFNGDRAIEVSGVTGAAPLWQRIMLHLHETKEPDKLPPPERLVKRPICALSGLRPTPACPTIVQEYFYPEDLDEYERQFDTFYQVAVEENDSDSLDYSLNLPSEYDEWVGMQRSPLYTSGNLKILSPRNGDVFLLDDAASQLEFKLAGVKNQPVEWWLNDRKLATSASNSLFWSLQPGNWTLQVKAGEKSDRVHFEVLLTEHRPLRRGFSIAQS